MSVLSTLAQYRQSLKGATHLETTQLQLINLDLLKARYQERWPKVRSRIFDTCEQFIQKRMGPDDVVLRANNGFVILPGASRNEPPEAFTARIETEMKAFFLGTDYLRELGLEADTVNLAVADIFGATPDEAGADNANDNGSRCKEAPDQPVPGPLTFSPFSLSFEPLWASASSYVALHRARAAGRMDAKGPVVRDHLLCPAEGGAALRLGFDKAFLEKMACTLTHCQVPGIVAVPVHFETLAAVKYRLPYMACVNEIGEGMRARLMLNIVGMPMDAPTRLITEVCRIARMLTRRIMVEIDPATLRLERFDDAMVDIFTFTAPSAPTLERRCTDLERLSIRLRTSGRMLAVEGCDALEQLVCALTMQPAYLGGLMVGAEVRDLPQPYRLELKGPGAVRAEQEPVPCAGLPF